MYDVLFRSYEILAVGVLDECRKEKDDLAQTLVVKELEHLGGLTTLDIAVSANNQDFIAHPTCQTLLSRLWMGALYVNTSFWRVSVTMATAIIFFTRSLVANFRTDNPMRFLLFLKKIFVLPIQLHELVLAVEVYLLSL